MLRKKLLVILIGVAAACSTIPAPDPGRVAQPRVVFVSLDGLKPEYYLRAVELGLAIPNLRSLMSRGIWAEGVTGVFPTMTYPSHVTLMTGVTPAQHGIVSNRYFDPTGRSMNAWYWYANDIRVPTLVSAVQASGKNVATIAWPTTINIGAKFNVPDFWRPGADHDSDRNLLQAVSSPPGILDAAGDFRGKRIGERNLWSDQERVDLARYVIEKHAPELVMLHMLGVDAAQHDFGPMSPEALFAVEEADRHIGEVLASIERTGTAQQTVIVIASDHGFLPATRLLQPNTLLRENGLITIGADGVLSWKAIFHADGGSAVLHLADPNDEATLAIVRRLFQAKAGDPASAIRRVLEREQIAAMGGDGVLAIEVTDGFRAGDAIEGEWSVPLNAHGTHGHPPDRTEMHASLIIAGVRERGSIGVVPMTSIAPTVARFLGVSLSAEAGEPLSLTSGAGASGPRVQQKSPTAD